MFVGKSRSIFGMTATDPLTLGADRDTLPVDDVAPASVVHTTGLKLLDEI